MSERRFVIKEVDDREAIFHPYEIAINESELRQRAVLMFNAKWTCKEDIRIDILLHGEGEKGELKLLKEGEPCEHPGCLSHVTHPCEGCGRIAGKYVNGLSSPTSTMEKEESNFGHFLKACDSQPSPTPTRQEWEAWANNVADKMTVVYGSREEHIIAIQNALLSMPIIPKE